MKLVTTTVSTAATVNNMYIYATMATANTTAESEMCGQQCSRKHPFDGVIKFSYFLSFIAAFFFFKCQHDSEMICFSPCRRIKDYTLQRVGSSLLNQIVVSRVEQKYPYRRIRLNHC